MKNPLAISTLILVGAFNANAQLFCVQNNDFVFPDLPRRAQIAASFVVRFNVTGRLPDSIVISRSDRDPYAIAMFEPSIKHNLGCLFFRRDTIGAILKMYFEFRPRGNIGSMYTELVADTELHITVPSPAVYYYGGCGSRIVNHTTDSSFVYDMLPFGERVVQPSDILVKRIFVGDRDSTLILRNNLPSYEAAILRAAAKYRREDFLQVAPAATHFFIRFRILHYSPECNCREIL